MSVCVCLRTNLKIHGKASKVDQSLYSVRQLISRLSDKLEALGSIQTLAVKWHLLLDSHVQTRFKSVLLIWHNAKSDQ